MAVHQYTRVSKEGKIECFGKYIYDDVNDGAYCFKCKSDTNIIQINGDEEMEDAIIDHLLKYHKNEISGLETYVKTTERYRLNLILW